MEPNRNVRQAVRYAITAMAAATTPTILHAQDQEGNAASLEEIVVTGSRLKVVINDQSISPVTSITTQDIQATGLTRLEDVLNNLPQVFAAQGSTVSNGSDGTATVNLRNLGANRTLVLVNGRRLGPGTAAGNNRSDLNQVPSQLVERVDILTGGASSVYGADAVAGVVNFVLNTKFEGVKLDANYSFNNHKQNNPNGVQQLVAARNFPLPANTVNTGYKRDFALLLGSNFADDKGNAVFFATYARQDAVLQASYDYSGCSLNSPSAMGLATGARMSCGGSGTNATGYFLGYNSAGTSTLFVRHARFDSAGWRSPQLQRCHRLVQLRPGELLPTSPGALHSGLVHQLRRVGKGKRLRRVHVHEYRIGGADRAQRQLLQPESHLLQQSIVERAAAQLLLLADQPRGAG